MQDIVGQVPSERDELIYEAWLSGKTLRVCAREFSTPVIEIERAIDRCLPVFNTATQMRAYKRPIQKLEDTETKYHAQAMAGDIDSAHVYARINERHCAMQGWSSVNVRLDPYSAQTQEQPTRFERIEAAFKRIAESGTPAQKALRKRLEELDPEEALARLDGAGRENPDAGSRSA